MGVSVAVLIDAPLERVWEAAADLASHVEWMADAERIDFATSRQSGIGTRMEVTTRLGPFRTIDVMEVTAWEPNRRIAVTHQGVVRGEGEFRLDPVAGGVVFTWSETLRFPWHLGGAVGACLAQPFFRWIWRRNLIRLRVRLTGV